MIEMPDRVRIFRALHQSGCFVMPNPWDPGSARVLERMGFQALATTSAGLAWSLARPDYGITVDDVVAHLAVMAQTTALPVNADFEGGFAVDPEGVARNVERAAETGVAGLSIEDSTHNAQHPIYDFALAVERIRAARQAIDVSGRHTLLTGRCENYLAGRQDLGDTIARLQAYAEAGAECVYAPGLRSLDDIGAVVGAVAPTPVNVLVSAPFATVEQLAALGVRRISVGGALARAAWTGVIRAAQELLEHGTFGGFSDLVTPAAMNGHFSRSAS